MIRTVFFLSVLSSVLGAVIFIDRFTLDCNKQFNNWSTSFTHNENKNAVVNLTIDFYKPLAKLMIYVKVNMALNEKDRECKWEFLRTVFNAEKVSAGMQRNFLVGAFVENLKKFMDFEFRFPLQPVSCFLFTLIAIIKKYFPSNREDTESSISRLTPITCQPYQTPEASSSFDLLENLRATKL